MIGCTCSRCQDEWRVVRDPSATEEPRPPGKWSSGPRSLWEKDGTD